LNASSPAHLPLLSPPGRFRALSLDLWFTTVYFEPGDEEVWRRARRAAIRDILVDRAGRTYPITRVEAAMNAVREALRAQGVTNDMLAPLTYLEYLRQELGSPVEPTEEDARHLGSAGMAEAPPRINPEARRLVERLEARGVPVVAISNTSRPGEVWKSFLDRSGGPRFRFVLASCDFGWSKPHPGLFHQAAERLGLPPAQLLHVGDYWELDVEGAVAAGVSPALYRGLWHRYPTLEERTRRHQADDGRPDLLRLASLEELDQEALWAPREGALAANGTTYT
jgi:HAD superfamily hydrolase (TIGR01509 family)